MSRRETQKAETAHAGGKQLSHKEQNERHHSNVHTTESSQREDTYAGDPDELFDDSRMLRLQPSASAFGRESILKMMSDKKSQSSTK